VEVFGVHPDEFGVCDQVADGFHEVAQGLALACVRRVDCVLVAFQGGHQVFVFFDFDLLALKFVDLFEVVV
jgi:hypothetical protein